MIDPVLDMLKHTFLGGGNVMDNYSFKKAMEEAKKQPSFYPMSIQTPKSLQSLGIDLDEVNEKVKQDIIIKNQNTKTEDDFKTSLNNAKNSGEFDDLTDEELYVGMLKSYKDRGFTIKGVDIDEEIRNLRPDEVDTEPQKEKAKSFVGRLVQDGVIKDLATGLWDIDKDIIGGVIGEVPTILGNTTGFIADVVMPKGWEFGDTLRGLGEEGKKEIHKILGVDSESLATDIGEFGTDIGTFFIPGGQATLAAKFPWMTAKITKLGNNLGKLAEHAPKTYNVLKSAAIGGGQAAKFDVITESEISPTSVAIGVVANPVFDKAGKVVTSVFGKDVNSGLQKVFRPGTKQSQKEITRDMSIIAGSLKANNKKPQDLNALYTDMQDIMRGLYTNKINPALKEASKETLKKKSLAIGDEVLTDGTISMRELILEALEQMKGLKKVKGERLANIFGQKTDLTRLKEVVKNLDGLGKVDLLEAELLKQYMSAISMAAKNPNSRLTPLEQDFIIKMNEILGNKMDDMVKNLTGVGIKEAKLEYGALSRHLNELNKRIIKDNNLTGDSLFAGLGKIGGATNIAQGNIKEGITQIITGEILKLAKDPDEILKHAIKQIYKPSGKQGVWTGVGSSMAGGTLDRIYTEGQSSDIKMDDSYLDDSYLDETYDSNDIKMDDSYLED